MDRAGTGESGTMAAERRVNMARKDNIEIFEDTQHLYKTNQRLVEAVNKSSSEQQMFGNRRCLIGFDGRTYAHATDIGRVGGV